MPAALADSAAAALPWLAAVCHAAFTEKSSVAGARVPGELAQNTLHDGLAGRACCALRPPLQLVQQRGSSEAAVTDSNAPASWLEAIGSGCRPRKTLLALLSLRTWQLAM